VQAAIPGRRPDPSPRFFNEKSVLDAEAGGMPVLSVLCGPARIAIRLRAALHGPGVPWDTEAV
jgi:hypothetical protein